MNMKLKANNTSASCVGEWVKKALYGSAVLGLAMTMGATAYAGHGHGHGHGYGSDGFETVTPYSRVAKLPVVLDENGDTDHVATYNKARAAALALADYVARTKDAGEGGDWVLGGTSKDCRKHTTGNPQEDCTDDEIAHAILGIPSPEPIDPALPVSKTNTKKANVLDFCNEHYAKQALGVAPIIGDKKVVNGYSHAPALPCEVSIWNDGDHIYVDMLDPNAIFSLFFTDVLISEDMQDPAFAEAISALPPKVKSEIKAIILQAMEAFDPKTKAMNKKLGPKYKSMDDVLAAVDAAPYDSPYKHVAYTKVGGGVFTLGESSSVTQAIIDTMSIHGAKDEDGNDIAGIHDTVIDDEGNTLDSILSPKSSWRSARATPLTLPGKNHIIEACSPKYAKMAMSTGLHHVTALPCEISVQIVDRDGDGAKESLVISYLDPHFMLGAMFADISEEDKAKFGPIPGAIMDDLQKVVAAALEVNSGIDLNPGVQISYDMLP
jgi:uncharacterized protein (DUF302 family)